MGNDACPRYLAIGAPQYPRMAWPVARTPPSRTGIDPYRADVSERIERARRGSGNGAGERQHGLTRHATSENGATPDGREDAPP
jgi:hypothetical protein